MSTKFYLKKKTNKKYINVECIYWTAAKRNCNNIFNFRKIVYWNSKQVSQSEFNHVWYFNKRLIRPMGCVAKLFNLN